MSNFKLVLSYLRARLLVTILTVLSVALGLALAAIVLIISNQTQRTLNTEVANWDMVIGAKGSPLQVTLNSLYYLDAPAGNVSTAVWEHLKNDTSVERIIPLTMGDNYLGAPIVGTTPEFFDGRKALGGGELIAQGKCFAKSFEAVVGADVAAKNRLELGQKIVGAHGWGVSGEAHDDAPYTVVGILAPTGTNLDRAVYTDYHSTWEVHSHEEHEAGDEPAGHHEEEHEAKGHHDEDHEHETVGGHHEDEHEAEGHDEDEHEAAGHDEHEHMASNEVTSLLVRLNQPGARFQLAEHINKHEQAQAVIPVNEIDKLSRTFIAPLQGVLLLVAYLVALVSALSILISLFLSIHQRRRDLAIIRSLGATRANVFGLITLEAAVLSGLGVTLGWLLGHGAIALFAPMVITRFGIVLDAWRGEPFELVVALSVWALGITAGLLPAAIAYRLPVADTLIQE